MSARLVVREPDGRVRSVPLGAETTIGSAKSADVIVERDQVSELHTRITAADDGYWIEDAQSSYGTFVNGGRIDKARLRHFDVVTIGTGVSLVFLTTTPTSARVETATSNPPNTPTIVGGGRQAPGRLPKFAETINSPPEALTPRPQQVPRDVLRASAKENDPGDETRLPIAEKRSSVPPAARPAGDTPIAALRLTGATGSFKTTLGTCVVGRGSEAGIRIDSKEISRRHAIIVVRPDGITVEDLKSANGTSVNGTRITAPARLQDGDALAFSGFRFRVEVFRLER